MYKKTPLCTYYSERKLYFKFASSSSFIVPPPDTFKRGIVAQNRPILYRSSFFIALLPNN